MPKLRADEDDAEDLADLLARREGLGHLRVRHRGDLLTLESGDKVDAEGRRRHVRFRRATVHYWTLEAATHTGRWERTGFRDTLPRLVDVLVTTLGWTIASLE